MRSSIAVIIMLSTFAFGKVPATLPATRLVVVEVRLHNLGSRTIELDKDGTGRSLFRPAGAKEAESKSFKVSAEKMTSLKKDLKMALAAPKNSDQVADDAAYTITADGTTVEVFGSSAPPDVLKFIDALEMSVTLK